MTAQRFTNSAVMLRPSPLVKRAVARARLWCGQFVVALVLLAAGAAALRAQSVRLDGPPGPALANLTPRFTVRVQGLPRLTGQLEVFVYISLNSTGDGPFHEVLRTFSADTIIELVVNKLLPSKQTVYWKARVIAPNGLTFDSPISGPRETPRWLKLLEPNSPRGDQFALRRPLFRWESGAIDPTWGQWIYTIEILEDQSRRVKQSGLDLTEPIFRPQSDLEANTQYRWQVTATASRSGESVQEKSLGTFGITDPELPTTTLLYQNFPNPFPSVTAFATCFWFDVQTGGSRVSLDIVDLRGTLVKTILPSTALAAGSYGRGPVGAASNCDNRYVWDGTATDGRSVPGGVYLARFNATGRRTSFKKIVFRGR